MRGFTLVELLMVIVLIGILAAVVGPRFFDRQVFDERLFFEESLAAVRYGQKLAVASGCPIRIQIRDGNDGGYSLSYASSSDNNCIAGGTPVRNPSGEDYAAELPSGVIVQQELDVTFNSLGCVKDAAACGSGVSSAQIGAFSLDVHGRTGFVEAHP